MYHIRRRIDKVEKQFFPPEELSHIVNIAGLEMSSDEFKEIMEKTDGTLGVPPSEEEKRVNERYS